MHTILQLAQGISGKALNGLCRVLRRLYSSSGWYQWAATFRGSAHTPRRLLSHASCVSGLQLGPSFDSVSLMRDFLSADEIGELKAANRAERESRYADRIKAALEP